MSSIVLTPSGQPASPVEGEVYYDSTADKLKVRDASGFKDLANDNQFVGMIAPFAMATPPTGWLACDGSTNVSKTAYADLYNALTANDTISNPWGSGDDSSTFALPDLQGAFLRGAGDNASNYMAKDTGSGTRYPFSGPSVGSFENDQAQTHAHTMILGYNSNGSTETVAKTTDGLNTFASGRSGEASTMVANGQGTPRVGDETRPFNAGVKYCIKY